MTAVALCAADNFTTLEIKPGADPGPSSTTADIKHGDLPPITTTAEMKEGITSVLQPDVSMSLDSNAPVILTIHGDDYGQGRPLQKIQWYFTGTNLIKFWVSTNLITNWYPVAYEGPGTNRVKQVGEIQTNRVLNIGYIGRPGRTNLMILDILGKQDWYSQRRIVTIPRSR